MREVVGGRTGEPTKLSCNRILMTSFKKRRREKGERKLLQKRWKNDESFT